MSRVVFLTGGGGRLGRRIAVVLARDGAAVVVADRDRAAAERAVAACGGSAVAIEADVTDERDVERALADATAALGPPDGLVNAAGLVPSALLLDVEVDEWDRVFAVNVRGTMLVSRALARRWVASGTRGAIVNLSSVAAASARRGSAHYCASKAAVDMLTRACALELGEAGIRVNAVAPGLVLDEVLTAPDGAHPYVQAMLAATPLGRTGAPDEVAEAVAFLLSERSVYTTGAILEVTGGVHVGRTHMPASIGLQ
jgi:NAD(P)-dependent dehydrogenase (short-subunit alcohol dehydrogenase family)